MSKRLFADQDLDVMLKWLSDKACQEVDQAEEDYILNISENDFVEYLVSKYKVNLPQLGDPSVFEPKEVDVDVGDDPMMGIRHGQNRSVKGCLVNVRIPFAGDSNFFSYRPSSYQIDTPLADLSHDHLDLVYVSPGPLNAAGVKLLYERDLALVRLNLTNIESQCTGFNSLLEGKIRQFVTGRKVRLLTNRRAILGMGLPIQRRANAPLTYTVPDIKRKAAILRPTVTQKSSVLEPTLDQQEYEHILSVIKSMVLVTERSPKAFGEMGEEIMRWHFLVQLNGQYDRASGETFNYQGKTDILIRDGDRNVFIAECKIWNGEAELLKAIDQVLGYLHWRDTKAAVLIFNRNKSFSDVLGKVSSAVQSHSCCKKLIEQIGATEWRFLFRNQDDPNRELQLAVLCFDVPKEAA
jgi:hypothetical protein